MGDLALFLNPAARPLPLVSPGPAPHKLAALDGQRATSPADAASEARLRRKVGEIVGSVFYAHLIAEMEKSTFKTPLMHGGRGEEVFNGQLRQELGRRIGVHHGEPLTERLLAALNHRAKAAALTAEAGPP
jgi:hypothetical protein